MCVFIGRAPDSKDNVRLVVVLFGRTKLNSDLDVQSLKECGLCREGQVVEAGPVVDAMC